MVSSRRIWYRLSQEGTLRKNAADDDRYVRVTWVGSTVQSEVHKIVTKWLSESRTSGRGGIKGSQNLGAMFGWGAAAPPKPAQEHKRNLSLVIEKAMPAVRTHSRHASEAGSLTPPLPSARPSIERTHTPSPLTPSFGWASQPSPFLKTTFSVAASPLHKTTFDTGVLDTAQSSTPGSPRVSSTLGHSSMHNSPTVPSFATAKPNGTETPKSLQFDIGSLGSPAEPSKETKTPTAQTATSGFGDWDKFDILNQHSAPHPPAKATAPADDWSAFENLVSAAPSKSLGGDNKTSQVNTNDEWALFESIKPSTPPAIPSGPASPISSRNSTNISRPSSLIIAEKLSLKPAVTSPVSEGPVPQIQASKPAPLSISTNAEPAPADDDDEWGEMQSPTKSEHDITSIPTPVAASPTTVVSDAAMERFASSVMGGTGLNGFSANAFPPPVDTLSPRGTASGGFDPGGSAPPPATTASSSIDWDLSFFEKSSKVQPAPPSQPVQKDLWDAPKPAAAPTRGKKEMEEDAIIKKIIDGLPDLSYMLV
jgi:hypothetical protein